MAHNDDKSFDIDNGFGPNGPDGPKLHGGTEIPSFPSKEGSIYWRDNGEVYRYKTGSWALESISDLTEAEATTSEAQELTTSDGWVSKTGFPFLTIGEKTAGKFSIRWSAEVGQTKTNRNFGFRVRWRPEGGTWADLGLVQLTVNRDGDLMMQAGFKEVTLATNSKIEVDAQYGQTVQGQSAIIQNTSMELRRIGD